MAITVDYAPMSATGKLGQAAGAAINAAREREIAANAEQQAKSIAANKELQAMSIAANKEMQQKTLMADAMKYQQQLTAQTNATNASFASNLGATQQAITSGVTQAAQAEGQVAAADAQYTLGKQQLALQEEQLATQQDQQALAFKLQEAAAARAEQKLAMEEDRNSMLNLVSQKKVEAGELSQDDKSSMVEQYQNLYNSGKIDSVTYQRSLAAIAAGKVPPALPVEPTLTPYQQQTIAAKTGEPLSTSEVTLANKVITSLIPEESLTKMTPGWSNYNGDEMLGVYKDFLLQTNYPNLSTAQKANLDNIWEGRISQAQKIAGGDDEVIWGTQERQKAESYKNSLTSSVPTTTPSVSSGSYSTGTTESLPSVSVPGVSLAPVRGQTPVTTDILQKLSDATGGNKDLMRQLALQYGYRITK